MKRLHNEMKFGTHTIPRVSSFKLLGVIIDDKLSWQPHINDLLTKCFQALNILKSICRVWWGADPLTCLMLYKALVRSRIDYSSFLFANTADSRWKKVERIQNSALRLILGAFPSTPIPALQAEAGVPPLRVRAQLLADKYILKNLSKQHHPLMGQLRIIKQNLLINSPYWLSHNVPLLVISYSRYEAHINSLKVYSVLPCFMGPVELLQHHIPTLCSPVSQVDRNVTNLPCQISLKFIDDNVPNFKRIFTDGSKTKEGVGAAFWDQYSNFDGKYKLQKICTIFTAEAFAISRALSHIGNSDVNSYAVLTDSKSVVQALQGDLLNANTNFLLHEIKIKHMHLKNRGFKITIIWIPSHCSIAGNDRADELAKDAIITGTTTDFKPPYSDYLSLANLHLKSSWRENWQLSWEAITHRRKPEFANQPSWYQQVQPSLPDNPLEPWFKNINRTREFYSTITRLRIGHCCAPSHIKRIDIDPEASCECGLLAATLQHMVFECNIALAQRAELIQALERLTTAPPPGEHWSLINLLKKNNPNILDSLFRFIKSTNMPTVYNSRLILPLVFTMAYKPHHIPRRASWSEDITLSLSMPY